MKTALIAAAALILAGTATYAQDSNSEANAGSNSASSVDANLFAGSAAYGNNITYNEAQPRANTRQTVRYDGDYVLRNTPGAAAPGVVTAHTCALGVGAGGSLPGVSLSIGGAYVDKSCELISQAAALNTLAGSSVALAHLARDTSMCQTLRASGVVPDTYPCTRKERKAYAKAQSTRPVARPASMAFMQDDSTLGYDKCYKRDDGRVGIRFVRGIAESAKQTALNNCYRSLGYSVQ